MHNFYRILEVTADAPIEVIKKAYRDKALSEHPDKGGNSDKMALLTAAYQTLKDPVKRRQFDQEWEIFNAANDVELTSALGHLPSAGVPFSARFRKQHTQLVEQYRHKPLDKNKPSHYLKPFCSDLYPSHATEKNHGDLFAFIKNKEAIKTNLTIPYLTPEKSVKYFLNFLAGDYSVPDVQDLSEAFSLKIEQLKEAQPSDHELRFYQGIYEILSVAAKGAVPNDKLLTSLQKITDYAQATADQSIHFFTPLLQSRYFRNLFSQALHNYWLSDEHVTDESFLKALNGQFAAEKLIEQLKKRLSENRELNESSNQLAKQLRYARLLFRLEKDLQKREDTTDHAAFYRKKAFHLLDWLSTLLGFAEYSIIANTFLQIGINFQKAAAQETKPEWCMADEKLAIETYLLAVSTGRHATPDIELYACLYSVKALMACRYTDSEFKETLEALQHRTLWLADVFPFFQAPRPNSDLLSQDDKTVVLMRQLLHTLINQIGQQDKAVAIDHSYVRIFYQAYEACLKNWYQKNHDTKTEKKFRQRLMQELLVSKQWTTGNLNYNLNAPWPLSHLDEEGWTRPKPVLPLAENADIPTYKTIGGVELNYKTGEIALILNPCQKHESDYERLLTLFDLGELFHRRLTSAIFSLDAVDPDMPYHPFNQMRFAPSTLYNSQLLHTMLLTDYLLKFLTVGQEVQRRDPYELRSLDHLIQQLPDYLKKVIDDFHASKHEESLNRFWIESEAVDLAIDDRALDKDGHVLFALGNIKMVVKHHKLRRDAEGNLVDQEDEEENWACYVLTLEQKRELEQGKRTIPDSALIIIQESWELIFWENNKVEQRCVLENDKHHLVRLSRQARDTQGKVKTDNAESVRQIYRIVLKAAKKTGLPHRYSPEFIFAQEFTKYYDEFAIYFPEFGRLRELSKAATLINIVAAQREANQEEIQLSKKRLQDKPYWGADEYLYWQETEQRLKKLVRENIVENFNNWRRQLSKEKITQERQKTLQDLRKQIGSLKFTESSPEVQSVCDAYYEEIRREMLAKHGYSAWNSVSHKVRSETIRPKIPSIISELQTQKRNACREQLLKLFEAELAGLSSWHPTQLVDKFLEGDDRPLLEQLVKYDRKEVVKKIQTIYPGHTEATLERALSHSLLMIDDIVETEIVKVLEQHKQQLKTQLGEREKLEKSFMDLGFATDAEAIDLKETCLWVPASFRHDSDKGNSRTVYGGVHILGIAKHVDPNFIAILANQTTAAGQRLCLNQAWGRGANNYHASLVGQQYPAPYVVKPEHFFGTPHGARFLDVAVLSKEGKYEQGYEVKTGNSVYTRTQQTKDQWIQEESKCPVELVRYPGCPIQ